MSGCPILCEAKGGQARNVLFLFYLSLMLRDLGSSPNFDIDFELVVIAEINDVVAAVWTAPLTT